MHASTLKDERSAVPGAGQVLLLAWPMTLKAVFLHGTIVIDGWLVSSLGEQSLAAMGLAAAIGGIALGVIFAFSHAMQIRTAQVFGAHEPVFQKSVLVSGLFVSLSIGIFGLGFIFAFGENLIIALAPSDDIAAEAWSYLAVFSLVILLETVGQCLSSYFNGCGRTRLPLYGYCLSVPINVLASVVLIHGYLGMPALGVVGAAMGSVIAILVQVAFFVVKLQVIDGWLRKVHGWRNGSLSMTLWRHIVFALPIAATFISATVATHVCTLIFANMRLNDFAALTLIAPWSMVIGQISIQWTQATGIIVAQLLGERASEETLDRFLSHAWRGAFVAAGVVAAVFVALALSVDTLYSELSDDTRQTLFSFLPILLLTTFPRTTNAICGNTLRASGDTIYVMHIFVWSQWLFRVPATALAVLVFDVSALWVLSIILAEELLKFWPFHKRLWRGEWKHADVAA
ncbi:MATE family efflux transporter [Shimia abyssi]|uniref:Na+-driven multidrug efflux pump n=1 Tax=Shimia abyssi TaxID=1662395 RepID=A0A2P8FAY9_9RHOB|nr:MATE family efflux transporter [Shimia abyssi]PSL18903.1 Na+-driven multidrug efflux pump [Shimia abyssi]